MFIQRSCTVSRNRYPSITKIMSQELKPEAHNEDIPEYNKKPKFKVRIG